MVTFNGVVNDIYGQSPDRNYMELILSTGTSYEFLRIFGNMANVYIGSKLSIRGKWKFSNGYRCFLDLAEYNVSLPDTVEDIEDFLANCGIQYIGADCAGRIVRYLKEKTFHVIKQEPYRLLEIEGIGKHRFTNIMKFMQEYSAIEDKK
jgi:exodeoxyribonuclease V alpha subunit